ncbi:MAG TPA: indole-3-glycerol phosphate synthase TrpC, partial [Acidimicrobiales bacterium]|nr:indole-3-glycerol phosphate synthase TrpC [Acidimicrobiales bacterium]
MLPATYLEEIMAAHRARSSADGRDVESLIERAGAMGPSRGFARALRAGDGLAVIAEVKRRSPSKGALAPDLDPAAVAADYAAGGARALSVLTDEDYFGARPGDLDAARAACDLPVLRKDFTVSEADVCDARLMGADAVLLIVAALSDAELARFATLAEHLSLDALVEVHDDGELGRALDAGARLVGVNQRDLATFEVDADRALALAGAIPDDVVAVAESGIRGAGDVMRLADAGYDAVLVGETLVTSSDRRTAVMAL